MIPTGGIMNPKDQLDIVCIGREGDDIKYILFYTAEQYEQFIKPIIMHGSLQVGLCDNIEYGFVLNQEIFV
jgi:hypothetical protein